MLSKDITGGVRGGGKPTLKRAGLEELLKNAEQSPRKAKQPCIHGIWEFSQ